MATSSSSSSPILHGRSGLVHSGERATAAAAAASAAVRSDEVPFTVHITRSETRFEAGGSHAPLTVFALEIVHGAERWLTMRRYSQFAQLDSELRDLYPKVRLPKLPPKSFALRHRTAAHVVARRLTLLVHYVRELLMLPLICESAIFLAWIRPGNEPRDTVSLNDVVAAGWVRKAGDFVRVWKRRWALLTREHVAVFKVPHDSDPDVRPIRIVSIAAGASVSLDADGETLTVACHSLPTAHAASVPTSLTVRFETPHALSEWCVALAACGVHVPPATLVAVHTPAAAVPPPPPPPPPAAALLPAPDASPTLVPVPEPSPPPLGSGDLLTDDDDSDAESSVSRSRSRAFTVSSPAPQPLPSSPRPLGDSGRRRSLSVSGTVAGGAADVQTRIATVKSTIDMAVILTRRQVQLIASARERADKLPADDATLAELATLAEAIAELSVEQLLADELFRAKANELRALMSRVISPPVSAAVARTLFAYSRLAQWLELAVTDAEKERTAALSPHNAVTAVPIASWTRPQTPLLANNRRRNSNPYAPAPHDQPASTGTTPTGSTPPSLADLMMPRVQSLSSLDPSDTPSPGSSGAAQRRHDSGAAAAAAGSAGSAGGGNKLLITSTASPSPPKSSDIAARSGSAHDPPMLFTPQARRRGSMTTLVLPPATAESAPTTPRDKPPMPHFSSAMSLTAAAASAVSPRMSPRLRRRQHDDEHVCRICESRVAGRRLEDHSRVCAEVNADAVRQLGWEEQIEWMIEKLEQPVAARVVVESDDAAHFVLVPSSPRAIDNELLALLRRARELRIDSSKAIVRCDQLTQTLAELLKNTACGERQHLFGARLLTLLAERKTAIQQVDSAAAPRGASNLWGLLSVISHAIGGEKKRAPTAVAAAGGLPSHTASRSSGGANPSALSLSGAARDADARETSIEDFDILKPISRGAFGRVYLARKKLTGDVFAIKVLKKASLKRKNTVARVLAERNIMAMTHNPFIVRLAMAFQNERNLYLVMEYLPGGDLAALLQAMGALDEDMARVYMAETVLALEYIHGLGIVHRDVKPENLLIDRYGHIKLTDFGLSRYGLMDDDGSRNRASVASTSAAASGSTAALASAVASESAAAAAAAAAAGASDKPRRGTAASAAVAAAVAAGISPQAFDGAEVVGTPDYLAPEILLAQGHGFEVDWWSSGIVLFELLVGAPPFNDVSPMVIFANILRGQIVWPDEIDEDAELDVSDAARELVGALLVQSPRERLGHTGAAAIKQHAFFGDLDWKELVARKNEALFVPHVEGKTDTKYFETRLPGNNDSVADSVVAELSSAAVEALKRQRQGADDKAAAGAALTTTPLVVKNALSPLQQTAVPRTSLNDSPISELGESSGVLGADGEALGRTTTSSSTDNKALLLDSAASGVASDETMAAHHHTTSGARAIAAGGKGGRRHSGSVAIKSSSGTSIQRYVDGFSWRNISYMAALNEAELADETAGDDEDEDDGDSDDDDQGKFDTAVDEELEM